METSQLIYKANQVTGFHMKCNTWLKWVNLVKSNSNYLLFNFMKEIQGLRKFIML